MTTQQRHTNLKFWILAGITLFLTGLSTFMYLGEFVTIGLLKQTSGYPFGGERPVPWYYETAELYAKVSLAFGLVFLFVLIIAAWMTLKRHKIGLLITFVSTIFLIIGLQINGCDIDQEQPDHWADNLTIPTNIKIDNPIDIGFREKNTTPSIVKETNLQLYNAFQPGLYEYDFWIGKIESGTIYLKAFEITQNIELSSDRLLERSAIKIVNPTDNIMKFGTTNIFTIYEGDWGKPYAARFEVWFKPDSGTIERTLFTKNYKIEGWMR
jgi:hypothetical protein